MHKSLISTAALILICGPFHLLGCNVQFILDESGSVGAGNYDNSIEFVKELIIQNVNDMSPVSAFSFSNVMDTLYTFNQDQTSRNGLLLALDNAKSINGNYQGQCTDTLSALQIAVTEYERADNDGDLVDNGDNLLFLITDGVPYCGCSLPSTCSPNVCGSDGSLVRSRIADLGIRVVTLGIGNFNIATINCLSDPNDVFQVNGFTDQDFAELQADVTPILDSCPEGTSTTTTSGSSGPIFVSDPLPCHEAQVYCRDVYGSDLATIANSGQRLEAVSLLGGNEQAWIGLYSDPVETKWRFRSGDECPSSSAFKCVDFWLYQMEEGAEFRPRCIGPSEDGYECAYFDSAQNGVDNNKASNHSAPFLCN